MNEITSRFSKDFIKSFNYCTAENLYLGLGNPESNILLIGKETSSDHIGYDEMGESNLKNWSNIISKNTKVNDIGFLEDNALFPWKGQKFTIRRQKENGTITGKEGTSTTWYYYQFLIDLIRISKVKTKDDFIDFHEFCFQSELNQLNSKRSDLIHKNDPIRINSIKDREKLFSLEFFKHFEIIILACGHYQRDFYFDIENTFKVKWIGKSNTTSKGNWYNIHYDDLKNPKRIVIHTRQFSTGITKELIHEIAERCRKFNKSPNL